MAVKAFVIPVAVLAAISVCMFAFICWWFPRAWAKGQTSDMREYAETARRRELAMNDIETGTVTSEDGAVPVPKTAPVKHTYVPAPVTPF